MGKRIATNRTNFYAENSVHHPNFLGSEGFLARFSAVRALRLAFGLAVNFLKPYIMPFSLSKMLVPCKD
jgi:hypothetical protein